MEREERRSPVTSKKRNLREIQKAMTLGIIKDAAREIFSSGQYDSVSVDDIARMAGVSRGTVYMHFKTKLDILIALVNDDLDNHLSCYEDFNKINSCSSDDIVKWLKEFIESTKSSNRFLAVFFRYSNSDNFSMIMDHRDRVVDILGRRYSGFNLNTDDGRLLEKRRAQCYMMISMIETASITYSSNSTLVSQKVGLEMLADVLSGFLSNGEIHSTV